MELAVHADPISQALAWKQLVEQTKCFPHTGAQVWPIGWKQE
jgi:hypothetical protein